MITGGGGLSLFVFPASLRLLLVSIGLLLVPAAAESIVSGTRLRGSKEFLIFSGGKPLLESGRRLFPLTGPSQPVRSASNVTSVSE
jgi:hypothetical protein